MSGLLRQMVLNPCQAEYCDDASTGILPHFLLNFTVILSSQHPSGSYSAIQSIVAIEW